MASLLQYNLQNLNHFSCVGGFNWLAFPWQNCRP